MEYLALPHWMFHPLRRITHPHPHAFRGFKLKDDGHAAGRNATNQNGFLSGILGCREDFHHRLGRLGKNRRDTDNYREQHRLKFCVHAQPKDTDRAVMQPINLRTVKKTPPKWA